MINYFVGASGRIPALVSREPATDLQLATYPTLTIIQKGSGIPGFQSSTNSTGLFTFKFFVDNPYIKVTGCMSLEEASVKPREGLQFGEGTSTLP